MKWPPYETQQTAGILGIYLLIATTAAFGWGIFVSDVETAPDYALGSEFIYRLERALVVAAAFAIPVLVVGPLLAGRLPAKLGKEGIDWAEDREDVVAGLEDARKRLQLLETAVRRIAGV